MKYLRKLFYWISDFREASKRQLWGRPAYTTYIVYLTASVVFGTGFLFMSTALIFAGAGGIATWALMYGIILLVNTIALLRVPIWAERCAKDVIDVEDDADVSEVRSSPDGG